jgi:hypothetical protein
MGLNDPGDAMDEKGNRWTVVFAAVSFVAAVAIAAVALLLAAGLVREYGPAEGYGNLMLQALPIVALGLGLGGLLTWAGLQLTRRRRRDG